jgi:PAS domain S-box-containing protein
MAVGIEMDANLHRKSNNILEAGTEAEMRTSEIRYRRLFESARDGILILDAKTLRIIDVNPFMVELLGYTRDEFLGREPWEIGLFSDKKVSQDAFRKLQVKGYLRYENLPLQTIEGTIREVEFVSNVYEEASKHVIQCNIRDITDRKRDEEERRLLLESAQAARAEADTAKVEMGTFVCQDAHKDVPTVKLLYDTLVEAKRRCGETTDDLSFPRFHRLIAAKTDALKERSGRDRVRFSIDIEDGRVAFKARADE